MEASHFIADVHLGKLARLLRMLGFDVIYSNSYSAADLVSIAQEQNRVLLSRNSNIGKHQPLLLICLIIHDEPAEQLKHVLKYFHLSEHIQPFARCMVCNNALQSVSKEIISNKLPEKTAIYYNEFWQCTNCHHIYWKGPHYNRMIRFIQQLKGQP